MSSAAWASNDEAAPRIVGAPAGNESSLVLMADGSVRSYSIATDGRVTSMRSTDHGVTWEAAREELVIPGRKAHASVALRDGAGELHLFYLQWRGEGRRLAVDRFLDIGHVRTTDQGERWLEPHIIWQGYCGALRGAIQMTDGRIVLPFGSWQPGRAVAPPTGSHIVTAIYSDDGGATWQTSDAALVAPCRQGYNGNNYGACEPVLTQLGDGRLWMVMRTQAGMLYESFSTDGAKWSDAQPTRFHSSNSPAALLRMKDNRVVIFWNNTAMPPRVNGSGVYGGRDALHAAISDDNGRTWRGFREVYRDPTRNDTPPRRGDRGTAYPTAIETGDGHILLATGQGEGRRALIVVEPDWLLETEQHETFDDLDAWHTYKPFGPAQGWWRDRTQGPVLRPHPDQSTERVLHVRHTEHAADGAAWNFPAGTEGELTLRIRLNDGHGGATIALADHFSDPTDDNGEASAMFRLDIPASGILARQKLPTNKWFNLTLAWNLDQQRCIASIDGKPAAALPLNARPAQGISYLRLRSAARDIDPAGFFVAAAQVRVANTASTAAANPRNGVTLHPRAVDMPDVPMGPFVRLKGGAILTVDKTDALISNDEGKTWQRHAIFNNPEQYLIRPERALVNTRKGVVILAFANDKEKKWTWSDKLRDAPGAVLPTYVTRSTDGGRTWEPPRKLHDEWTGAIRDIIETRDGRVVFTTMMMRNNPGRHTVLTYGSDDQGVTWQRSNIIDLGGAGHHGGVSEATLEQLNDGRLLMLIRTNWMQQWRAESRDDGRSWHPLGPANIPSSSAPAMIKRLDSGRLLLVWNRPFPEGRNSHPLVGGDGLWSATKASNHRAELSIAFSDDDAATWSKPIVVASKPNAWLAYPYVFEVKPGMIWLTTMQGNVRATLREADFAPPG